MNASAVGSTVTADAAAPVPPAAEARTATMPPLGQYWPLALIGLLFLSIYGFGVGDRGFDLSKSTIGFLLHRWTTDPSAQHGWLIIPISSYVAWRKYLSLREQGRIEELSRSGGHPAGLWVIGLALLLHLFEKAVDLNGPSPFSIPIFITGLVWYLYGTQWLRAMAFPIAYLLFMIPIPGGFTEVVSFPLRLLATVGAKELAELFGVHVQGAGMNIEFLPPYRTEAPIVLEIADPCSGLHSLMALKALHAITAYLTRLKLGWKWVLFMCAIPIALMANLTRIVGIIVLAAYVSRYWGLKLFHDFSSPMLFAIAFMILISIGRLMEWATRAHKNPPQNTLW